MKKIKCKYVQLFPWEETKRSTEYLLEKTAAKLQSTSMEASEKLKLIDEIQRLGIGHHFEDAIDSILQVQCSAFSKDEDLFTTALRFRLLRHAGFHVTPGTPTKSYITHYYNDDVTIYFLFFWGFRGVVEIQGRKWKVRRVLERGHARVTELVRGVEYGGSRRRNIGGSNGVRRVSPPAVA